MNYLKHTLSYHKGHPNPIFYRDNYILLNGLWKFYFDDEDVGLINKFYLNFPKDHLLINVPFTYQAKDSKLDNLYKHHEIVWYQKEIDITDLNKQYLIKFLGVDYLTKVFINGKFVYEHEGGYDSFEILLNDYLIVGKNKITLYVKDSFHIDQIRGKQRWRENNFTCFYKETTGIYKDVYIETLNDFFIKNFSFKGFFNKKQLKFKLEVNKIDNLKLNIFIKELNKNITLQVNDLNNEYLIDINEDIKPYNEESINLYNVKLTLYNKDQVFDEVLTYFGFIDLNVFKGRIYINSKDTYLKFVLNQGYSLDNGLTFYEDEIIKDLILVKKMGFNGLRIHEKVETPLFYYYLDVLGIYAWQEVPSAHAYSYELKQKYFKQALNQIKDHYSHPSIISYVLFNESWGINEIKESEEITNFVNNMYNYFKRILDDHFIISNDGREHVKSDLLTFHNYAGSYELLDEELKNFYNDLILKKNPIVDKRDKRFYVDGYRYNNEPIVFSEFCGIAFNKDCNKLNWGYGKNVNNVNEFLDRYKSLLKRIKEKEYIRGFCFTQLSDVEQEVNGLLTSNRSIKIDCDILKSLHDEFQ